MFSLQRLLSRKGKFFDLLEAGAEDAQQAVAALVELLRTPRTAKTWRSSSSAGGIPSGFPRS